MSIFRTLAFGAALTVSFILPTVAQTAPPSGAVYTSAPFSGANFFATAKCATQKFPCTPSQSRDKMTAAANVCAEETFGLSNIMGEVGNARNGYPGCVLPTTYKDDANAPLKKKWTVCCIVPAKTGAGMCTFDCHLYYNNN